MKALVLVDIQNDFLPLGSLAVPGGDQIVPIVNEVQGFFDLVVATQDWHPSDHKSFASNHPGKDPFDRIELNGSMQTLWPDHCVQGSAGAEFSPRLNMNKTEAIFRKGMDPDIDSYSGFYDNGRRKSTGLATYLRGRQVKAVYLAGLAADICVYFTGMDSLREGFATFIISDASVPLSVHEFRDASLRFEQQGGRLIKSAELRPE